MKNIIYRRNVSRGRREGQRGGGGGERIKSLKIMRIEAIALTADQALGDWQTGNLGKFAIIA